jgi:hypothetical protein
VEDNKTPEVLWKAILDYSEARLSVWMSDFMAEVQKVTTHCPQELPVDIQKLATTAKDGAQSDAVQVAHFIWTNYTRQDFIEICDGAHSLAESLRLSIGFLARLHIAFSILIRAAERLDKFQELILSPLPKTAKAPKHARRKDTQKTWTLAQTLQSLALSPNEAMVRTKFGKDWTMETLSFKFNKAQRRSFQFHAEVQLMMYTAQNPLETGTYSEYIGCSKRSCFICWEFMQAHGSFRTRASHGKLYHLWTVPEV